MQETDLNKLNYKSIYRLFSLLLKTKNLDRVIGLLDLEKLDTELTFYDKVPAKYIKNNIKVKDLNIPEQFKKLLMLTLKKLLPVQSLAVQNGLLYGKNQLVISATATGKTLIGELAGIKNILNKKGKMLFLVPLVALANQKYEQFKKYKPLNIC